MRGAAKTKYEASGKILWPDDLRAKEEKPEVTRKYGNQQQGLRI